MSIYDPISLRRAIRELERWAAEMRLWFKPQDLPLPLITIQGYEARALGWFARSRWESKDGAILNEINFVPEHLGREVFDIAETMVHELVHLANFVACVRDVSSNGYHNRHFRNRAVSVGLACDRMPPYGWARTALTPELYQKIEAIRPDASAFDLFRLPPAPRRTSAIGGVLVGADETDDGSNGIVVASAPRKKLSKWSCSGRCASVWAATGKELDAACLECGGRFSRM